MLKENLNFNTAIGTIAGVVVGRYLFKSKNVLFLTVFGVASGLLANYLVNKYKKEQFLKTKLTKIEEGIKVDDENIAANMRKALSEDKDSSFYGTNLEMNFNKQLGYKKTSSDNLRVDKPSYYMDLD